MQCECNFHLLLIWVARQLQFHSISMVVCWQYAAIYVCFSIADCILDSFFTFFYFSTAYSLRCLLHVSSECRPSRLVYCLFSPSAIARCQMLFSKWRLLQLLSLDFYCYSFSRLVYFSVFTVFQFTWVSSLPRRYCCANSLHYSDNRCNNTIVFAVDALVRRVFSST